MSQTEVNLPPPLTRTEQEHRQAILAINEICCAAAHLTSASLAANFHQSHDQVIKAFGLLDRAMYRMSRLGTERKFTHTGRNAIEEATRIFEALRKTSDAGWDLKYHGDKCMSVREWVEAFSVYLHKESPGTFIKDPAP